MLAEGKVQRLLFLSVINLHLRETLLRQINKSNDNLLGARVPGVRCFDLLNPFPFTSDYEVYGR